ncbi:MAG: preprotein translocase subunit SecG [Clostridia bacterium]|nr:preprotein translocase subunit SecG [Clostridia bacterium]
MNNFFNMIMASGGIWDVWPIIKIIALVIMSICALFVILVVMFQPGNSSGVGALGGQSETFLSKNKNKTFEHKMKKLTIISGIIFVVLCIIFAIMATLAARP